MAQSTGTLVGTSNDVDQALDFVARGAVTPQYVLRSASIGFFTNSYYLYSVTIVSEGHWPKSLSDHLKLTFLVSAETIRVLPTGS